MKATVVTWGSRGDFQPYLALSVALKNAGHEVILAAQPGAGFAALAMQHGVDFVPLGPRPESDALYQATANDAIDTGNPVKAVRLIMDQLMLPTIDAMYEQCVDLACQSDVLISHFFFFAGRMAAETTGTPLVSGTLVPMQLSTAFRPPEGLPNLGRHVNRLLWRMACAYMNAGWLGPVNETRTRHGLPPLADIAKEGFYSADLNLVAASPRIYRRPDDWLVQHKLTGYWLLDTPPGWTPAAEIEKFLESGPPPVAVGFGSMTSRDGRKLTLRVLRALKQAGVRAILEPGLAGLGDVHLGPDMLVTDGVPHSWLLTRVAALVHHGGAGTAAGAFHAGIPSVFVPHVFDQGVWAKRAQKLGVSPAPVNANELTSRKLGEAIERAVGDPGIRSRAQALGERLRAERGVQQAVHLIEAFVSSPRTVPTANGAVA